MKLKRNGAWLHIRPGLSLTLVLVALICLYSVASRPKAKLPQLHKIENIFQASAKTVTITPDMTTFSKETYYEPDGTTRDCICDTFSVDELDFPVTIYQRENISTSPHQTADYSNPMRWYGGHMLTIDAPTGYLIKKISFELGYGSKASTFTSNCGGTVTDAPDTNEGSVIIWELSDGTSQFSGTTSSQIRIAKLIIDVVPLPEVSLYLVGSFNGWNPGDENYRFTREASGMYVLELAGEFDSTVEFKTNGGSWDVGNWGGDGSVLEPGTEYTLYENGQNITLSRNVTNPRFEFNPKGTLTVTEGEAPTGSYYSIYGNIFGKTDFETRRMAENEDGALTYTASCTNGDFYIKETSKANPTDTVTYGPDAPQTLEFSPDTELSMEIKLSQNENMMTIPAGTYTFTFIPGEAPTVTITGKADKEPTIVDANIVYFDNTATQWTTPYMYWWGNGEQSADWPGEAMTHVEGTDYWYYILPGTETGMIFNNNGYPQTGDITGQGIVYNHVYTYAGSGALPTHKPYTGPAPDITAYLERFKIDEAEWAILCTIAESLSARGISEPWDMSVGADNAGKLNGVTVENKHVVELNLSDRNITGSFPTEILTLTCLQKLNLNQNDLEGELDLAAQEIMANPTAYPSAATLTELRMNGNTQQSGNISLFAKVLPSLTTLYAKSNKIAVLYPALPETITDIDLSNQTIDATVNFDLTNFDIESIVSQIPTIVLYDQYSREYGKTLSLWAINPVSSSTLSLWYDSSTNGLYLSTNSNGYLGNSGDRLNVSTYNAPASGSTFYMTLSFATGDANFDSAISVADLQSTINFAFQEYLSEPFNFTAADTYTDGRINVQDVVCTVNLLLAQPVEALSAPRRAPAASPAGDDPQARIYVLDGKVILESAVEIAALQVKAAGNVSWNTGLAGMTVKSDAAGMIAYSLSGATLPAGITVMGTCDPTTVIAGVSAANPQARSISIEPGQGDVAGAESAMLESNEEPNAVYDIYGRRIATPADGLNIIVKNGRASKVFNR